MTDDARRWDASRFYDLPFIGMAITSPSSKRWLHVNQTLCDILGYPGDELVEKTWSELTHPDDLEADVIQFDRVMRGDTDGYKLDKRFIRKDGATIYATVDVKCERRADGSVDRFFATVADITQRVKAELALRESYELLANLSRQVPGVIYQFQLLPDGRSRFPFASAAMWDIYEVTPEQVREDATLVFSRVHPDDLDAVAESIRRSAETLQPWQAEYRVVLPRQGVRWRSGLARPERLADGSTLWHGFITDVTAQRQGQDALAESEERYRVLIESAPEAIVVFDVDDGRFVDANANALRLFGVTHEIMRTLSPAALSPPQQANGHPSAEAAAQHIARALSGELDVFEWLHRTADGRVFPAEVRLVQLPSASRRLVRGSITDITEQQRAKQELERLNAAISSSINGIATASLQGELTYVNQAFLDLWGYRAPSEVVGRHVLDFWATPERAADVVRTLEAHGSDMGEMTAIRRDGTARIFQYNANRFRGPDGAPAGLLASFLDVTDKKRAEEDLRIKDQAIATSTNAVVIASPDGTVRYVNPAFVQLCGYDSADEILGRNATEFVLVGQVQQSLATLVARGVFQGELQVVRKNGSTLDAMVSANVVRDAAGAISLLIASITDVTESKRLHAELVQSQKMESVGRLAGGVAHDFNNLLTVMKGYVDFARADVPRESQLAEDLSEIERAVDSAAALTHQLLTFSRKQIISPRVLNLNESVTRMHGMLSRLLGEDIELRLVTAPDLGLVRFDPGQSEQMLVNLAVNARDAMPDGGRLTIETDNVALDDEFARLHPDAAPGEYVMVSVSDTGTGMSPEAQAHLFEPFFTTKSPGRGTGLGLPMVYGAVTQNGGRITVSSEEGYGTTFRIYLPRFYGDEVPPLAAVAGHLPRGTESIVVVEDEDAIRALAVRVLSTLGYRTQSFASGTQALRALESSAEPVDLVVTDVVMPEMKGSELARRLQSLRPGVRVLFASGYSEDVIAHHGVLEPGVDFLPKPYSIATLAQRVREALDRPGS